MSRSTEIAKLAKLAFETWQSTEPLRKSEKLFSAMVEAWISRCPIPQDNPDLTTIWATVSVMHRDVVGEVRKSGYVSRTSDGRTYGRYNVLSKSETSNAHSGMQRNNDALKKASQVAKLAKLIVNDLMSAKTTTGLLMRIVTLDFPTTSLYAGRAPLIKEINTRCDQIIRDVQEMTRTRDVFIKNAEWILELHN